MSAGYTFIHTPVYTAALVAGSLSLVGVLARRALKTSPNPILPETQFGLKTVFESFASFLIWLGDSAMGKENRKYLPFAGVLFLYLFCMNIMGLVPGFVMPTDQFHINLGIALAVFGLYNYWGIKEIGWKAYLKHLGAFDFLKGLLAVVGVMLFMIELISHIVRPVSLSLRLYGNMTGDHLVLGVFNELTQGTPFFWITLIFYVLGTMVCFIQAFVFTLLTMIYIRMATAHGDH